MIVAILAAVMTALYFIEFAAFHKKWNMNFKPFNCVQCLAAWLGLVFYFVPVLAEVCLVMFTAGILATALALLLNYVYNKTL